MIAMWGTMHIQAIETNRWNESSEMGSVCLRVWLFRELFVNQLVMTDEQTSNKF